MTTEEYGKGDRVYCENPSYGGSVKVGGCNAIILNRSRVGVHHQIWFDVFKLDSKTICAFPLHRIVPRRTVLVEKCKRRIRIINGNYIVSYTNLIKYEKTHR